MEEEQKQEQEIQAEEEGQKQEEEQGQEEERQEQEAQAREEEARREELIRLGEQYQALLSDPNTFSKLQRLLEEDKQQEQKVPEEEEDYETQLKRSIEQEIVNKYGLDGIRQRYIQSELNNIWTDLQNKYGEGVKGYQEQVLSIFNQHPYLNPQDIFKIIAFDDYLGGAIELGRQLEREDQQKRQSGRVIAGNFGSSNEKPQRASSVEEAFQLALQQLKSK